MGFYIRKALKVGPVRFNLSKSGIGMSAGVRGLRFGASPRGNYVHMGRGGLYFRQSLGSGGRTAQRLSAGPSQPAPSPTATVGPLEEIDSGSVLEMADASSAELLNELNDKRRKASLLPIVIVAGVLGLILALATAPPSWLLASLVVVLVAACWLASSQDALRKTTVVLYDLEPEVEGVYQQLHDAFGDVRSCNRAWHIEAQGDVRDRKYHGGAGAVVRRQRMNTTVGQPPLMKTNVEVPMLPVGRQTLAFMPDRLLVFEKSAVGAVSYRDLVVERNESRFIERESPAPEATVVGKTWEYVNKQGGPDRRFKSNRELPICLYDELRLSSASGLNEVIQLSRRGAAEPLVTALLSLRQLPVASSGPTLEKLS